MKERLVESWLTKINERGYGIPFCQILARKGYRVIRYGHSSIELGKDVLALAPDGAVCAYQLKSGDMSLSDVSKHIEQLQMLAATKPMHPALQGAFEYRAYLVTTGEFKDPAIALIKELNAKWQEHKWAELQTIGGRELLVDLLSMSSDFWPDDAPEMRTFLEIHLSRGRGDLEVAKLANMVTKIMGQECSSRELERRTAAANIFCSYALAAFYANNDHWSIFQAWTVCAAAIARMGEISGHSSKHWQPAFELAREGALLAIHSLKGEVLDEDAFRVSDRELDEYTRLRNTLAIAAAAASEMIDAKATTTSHQKLLALCLKFIEKDRLILWGEGAFAQFCIILWFLESSELPQLSREILRNLIVQLIQSNARESNEALDDPYVMPDQWLTRLISALQTKSKKPRKIAVQSYCLPPLIVLAARRDMRPELATVWRDLTEVRMTWFRPTIPADMLLWHCDVGREEDVGFDQPQSWADLREFASKTSDEALPSVFRDDPNFAMLFMLAFQHRISVKLTRFIDQRLSD